jgi:hypothetical protein
MIHASRRLLLEVKMRKPWPAARGHSAVTVLLLMLLLVLLPKTYGDQRLPVQPRWVLDLSAYGYRDFQHTWFPMWKRQQGLVFLSPKVLAVYQVSESEEPMAPVQRDQSGEPASIICL